MKKNIPIATGIYIPTYIRTYGKSHPKTITIAIGTGGNTNNSY